MLRWWGRLSSEERDALTASWPRQTIVEFQDLADCLTATGMDRTEAERRSLEQLLREMYPERVDDDVTHPLASPETAAER